MKKKLLTLFALIVGAVGSAWADTTIFSYTVSGTTNLTSEGWDSKNASGTIGGSCSFYYKENKGYFMTFNETDCYYFSGNDASIRLTLANNEKFQAGDKVKVTFSANGSSDRNIYVRTGYKNQTNQLSSATHQVGFSEETVTLTANFNLNEIYIERNGGLYVSSIQVDRPVADTNSPKITTDLSSTPINVDVNVGTNLSIVAEHVTGYQWYRNSSASTTGATAISGATTATYAYTAPVEDAESTVYFYCVATNDNATGTKTATSSFAQVNIGALSTLTAVTNQIWNIADFSKATYNTATIVNNLEICNGTIDSGSKTIDGFTLSQRIKINKDVNATTRYIKFKVGGPCVITVYGMTGNSAKTRVLGIKIAGTEVATLSHSGSDMGKKSYTYTGSSEAEVVLFCKEGDGTFNVHGITVSDIAVTISQYEWSTFVSTQPLALDGISGLEAYIVTGHSGSALEKTQMTGTVPANTPLLVKGTANSTFYIPMAGGSSTDVSSNKLVAGTGVEISAESGKTRYVLSLNGSSLSFMKIVSVPATVPVGKAYLEFDGEILAPTFGFGDATNINTIANSQEPTANGQYYNLNGQRVAQPTKGLYIVNGRKVIMK